MKVSSKIIIGKSNKFIVAGIVFIASCAEQKSNHVVQIINNPQSTPVATIQNPRDVSSSAIPSIIPSAIPNTIRTPLPVTNTATPLRRQSSSPQEQVTTTPPSTSPSASPQDNLFTANWAILKPISDKGTQDVSFVDFQTGWIVGPNGTIKKTTNAGASWISQNKGTNDLFSVSFINSNIGWVAGAKGVIFKTIDGGKNWNLIDSTTSNLIRKIRFYNENYGVFSDDSSVIYHTHNGGESWEKVEGVSGYEFLIFDENKIIFYSENDPQLYENGSISSIKTTQKPYICSSICGVHFKNVLNGYIYGSGFFIKTNNSGKSWEPIEKLITEDEILKVSEHKIYGLSFSNEQTGIIVTSTGNSYYKSTYYTIDGGNNWKNTKASFEDPYFEDSINLNIFDLNTEGGIIGWGMIDGIYKDILKLR